MKIFVFLIYLRGFLQFNVIRVIHYDNLIDSVCFQVTFELYQVSITQCCTVVTRYLNILPSKLFRLWKNQLWQDNIFVFVVLLYFTSDHNH